MFGFLLIFNHGKAAQDQQRRPPPPLVEVPSQLKLKAVGPTLVFLFFFLLPMTVTVQVFFSTFFSFLLLQSPLATENVWFFVDLQPRFGCSRPSAPSAAAVGKGQLISKGLFCVFNSSRIEDTKQTF